MLAKEDPRLAKWMKDHKEVGQEDLEYPVNYRLSEMDKIWIQALYPKDNKSKTLSDIVAAQKKTQRAKL